ncbi:MAG TPA: ATP-binding protein [Steroidobacteraceae bacterium]|nr:ATP-binding protein [Steroidobacteraceae bacterium]
MPSSQLLAVMDAAVDAVILMDQTGRIQAVNGAGERMFGWPPGELAGRNVGVLMPEAARGAHDGYIARYLQTGVSRIIGIGRELQAQRRDGRAFPAFVSVGRVAGAEPPQFVGFIRDTTAQHEHIADVQHEARRSVDRLMNVSRMATMGEMAAGIAHELNQPLTAIANYARASERFLAMPEPELDEVREAVREIAGEALRAGAIIRRLRELVRGGEEARENTPVARLVEELRLLTLADARMHGVSIRFDLHADAPEVFVHPTQIMQALLNLIRNALESTAGDAAGRREVLVRSRRNDAGDCEIEVCDNGPGVAPEILDRMFDPFLTTKQKGTGLGLPMSRTIAEAHGGSLRHEPVEPRGARFILTLPAAGNVA